MLLLALGGFLLHLWAAGRYGFHRDELYYVAGGLRYELGYVDHPPLVPWLAAATTEIFGLSLRAVRVWAALGAALSVLLAAAFARTLGGNQRAEVLAALATLLCPFYWFNHTVFQTNLPDQLAWCAALLLFTRAVQRAQSESIPLRSWAGIGALLFLGALAKYTMAVLGLSLALALLIARRGELRRGGLYLAGALALLGAAPSLWWQQQHGWPFLAFGDAKEYWAPWVFVPLMFGMLGPGALPQAWCGAKRLLARDVRVVGLTAVCALIAFLVLGTKPYYANPLFLVLFGAGAVALAQARTRWPEFLLLGNLVVLPVLLPVLSLEQFAKIPDPIGEVSEMVGWPELVEQVQNAYRQLPAQDRQGLVIVTGNYGEAGALELLWRDDDRPPVISGHNSYAFWMQQTLEAAGIEQIERALVLGFSERTMRELFQQVRPLGKISNPWGIENEEFGGDVFFGAGPTLDKEALLERLERFG